MLCVRVWILTILMTCRNVDGRDIVVQFAKYGPNAEAIYKGRLTSEPPYSRGKYRRSHSPRHSSRRDHDDYRHRDYRRQSRSRDRHERYRYSEREREYRRRTPSRSISPTFSRSRSRSRIVVNDEQIKRSCSRSLDRILKSRLQIVVALVGVIPMESQMCLQFQYQCFVFWCWTYSMFKQFNCWMLCGAVETLLVAVVAMMMGWGHVFLDAGDAVVADKRESCTQFLLLILMLALKC